MTEFLANLQSLYKKASFWVATLGAGAVSAWSAMPPEMQASLMSAFPKLQSLGPMVWLAAFMIARAVPQKAD